MALNANNDSKIEILRTKLSKMVLNDSRIMYRQKQTKKTKPIIDKTKSIENKRVRRRILSESDDFLNKSLDSPLSKCPPAPKKPMKSITENDLLGHIRTFLNNAQICDGKEIGIQASKNNVHLIRNSKEFNEQMLIDANGNFVQINNIIQPNDVLNGKCQKIKLKLIPVIESFTLVENSVETEYKICIAPNDCNNNNNNNNVENKNSNDNSSSESNSFSDRTTVPYIRADWSRENSVRCLECDESYPCLCPINIAECALNCTHCDGHSDDDYSSDETMKATASTIRADSTESESLSDYNEFLSSISSSANSTFISDNDSRKADTPFIRKTAKSALKMLIYNPESGSSSEESSNESSDESSDESNNETEYEHKCIDNSGDTDLTAILEEYQYIHNLYECLGHRMKNVERKLIYLLRENSTLISSKGTDFSITGIGSISDFTL